jgi:hypothetical protein
VEYDTGTDYHETLDVHGSPDGGSVFALSEHYFDYDNITVHLHKRTPGMGGPGTWEVVASIPTVPGSPEFMSHFVQLRVISDSEVYILGDQGDHLFGTAVIWKWNGSTLSKVYEHVYAGASSSRSLWLAEDGSEGWALLIENDYTTPSGLRDCYVHFDGISWSLYGTAELSNVAKDITQIAGDPTSTVALAEFGYYNKRDGIGTWFTPPPAELVNYDCPGFSCRKIPFFYFDNDRPYLVTYTAYAAGSPPSLANEDPGSGATGVARDVTIRLDILNSVSGVNASTVELTVQGTVAWTGDAVQPGFTVIKSLVTDGFRYAITPDTLLPSHLVITIGVYAEDLSSTPNVLDTSYNFTTIITPPQVTPVDPLAYESNVDTTTDITLDVEAVDGLLNDAATIIQFNSAPVWMNDLSVHTDYPITRTPLLKGWRFVINPVEDLTGETSMLVAVHAENDDLIPAITDTAYPFTTRTPPCVMFGAVPRLWGALPWGYQPYCDPTCFTGPLNPTEQALLLEFSGLVNTEKLRRSLVQYVVLPGGTELEAARSIFLRAHMPEFAPTMFQIVPVPTEAEKAVRLCNKATDLSVSNNLRRKPNYLPGAIQELAALGLPYEHRKLFEAYSREDQPSIEVPLACVIILLAKAFE